MSYLLDQSDVISVAGEVLGELIRAKRPLFIFGAGGRHSYANEIMDALGVPCVVTWGAADTFSKHPLYFGTFGTHGLKGANLAVQNADYIVCVGARLDTKATGYPASAFAPKAKLVMIDVDAAELGKMQSIGRPLYRSLPADGADFLRHMLPFARQYREHNETNDDDGGYVPPWIAQLTAWRSENPPGPGKPYEVMRDLGETLRETDTVVSDTGCSLAWAMQALDLPCRFVHAFNQTPMGYGLPAAIGAAFATGKRVVLITGDGGLMVNIGELATVAAHKLPIKIVLFENRAHAMCTQTQRQWLQGRYSGTSEGDLSFPDFDKVFKAFGIDATIHKIDPEQGVTPQIKYGEALA